MESFSFFLLFIFDWHLTCRNDITFYLVLFLTNHHLDVDGERVFWLCSSVGVFALIHSPNFLSRRFTSKISWSMNALHFGNSSKWLALLSADSLCRISCLLYCTLSIDWHIENFSVYIYTAFSGLFPKRNGIVVALVWSDDWNRGYGWSRLVNNFNQKVFAI